MTSERTLKLGLYLNIPLTPIYLPNLNISVQPPKSWMLGGWWWANPLQTFPQGPLLTFHVDPDPELDNFLVHFLSIYDDLMSHHVPSPPGYDAVMTEQVSGPKEPKLLGRHMPSVPNQEGFYKPS